MSPSRCFEVHCHSLFASPQAISLCKFGAGSQSALSFDAVIYCYVFLVWSPKVAESLG